MRRLYSPGRRIQKDAVKFLPPRLFALSLLSAVLGGAALAHEGVRTWTDVDGRKVEAAYLSHDEKSVTMRLSGGQEANVPLERLSHQDMEFLEELGKASGGEAAGEEALNWDAPWPETIDLGGEPTIEVVEENAEERRFIYISDHYRFTSDVRLSKQVVSTFADMFEATQLFCRSLPLGMDGGRKREGRYDILLFETFESYVEAGGPPTSAGVFIGRKNLVMVPLTSLGVKKVGSGYMRDRSRDDGILVHELVHQLTPPVYFRPGARGWFTEGIAEYGRRTPYGYGRFKVKGNLDDIREKVIAYGKDRTYGRALGEEIAAPPLERFMLMDYGEFTAGDANFNYGFATLLAVYFFELDGEGDAARMKAFLKALREAGPKTPPRELLEPLLDGRSFEELQEDISKAWKSKGVKIEWRAG